MSIWKSPVFYFGIALVALIMAALMAPFVINWNGYRDNLERWGKTLSGREVAINGPIAVRLFPWPRLVVEDVSLANPKGFETQEMMHANRIDVQLALAGLFSGEIRVEGIDVVQPTITLSRNAAGEGNWLFMPTASPRQTRLLDDVKLEQINIIGGKLSLQDATHKFSAEITDIAAVLSASAFEGPWRMRGTAMHGDVPLDLTFTSSVYKTDEPFKFGLRVAPNDGTLPALSFDGAQDHAQWKGKLRVEPVVTEDGRQSLDSNFKPLAMQSNLTANFDALKLDAIRIVPTDTKDSGTLIEGSADVAFGNGVKANVKLTSPRIDLDKLAGAQSLRIWRAGGVMALLNQAMANFPDRLDLTANVDVTSLSAAGETLDNVKLKASAQQGAVRIQDFTANLPGRSRMKFDGIAFPGDGAAELGGTLAVESNDTRALASWLWPEGKANLAKYWVGARGRLKAQSEVTWSGRRFGFQNLTYELDGDAGSGQLAVALGNLPSITMKLIAKTLDLDNYLGGGSTLIGGAGLPSLIQGENGLEQHVNISAETLRLNGVEAQNVAVDFSSGLSGFEVKALDIGSVEGARVKGNGMVLQGPDGPTGDVTFSVQAENPRGFLRMAGLFQKGVDPAWAGVLGRTNVEASVRVRPGSGEPKVKVDLSGASGPLQISATGGVTELAKRSAATLGLSADISSADGGDIARLFGLASGASNMGPGKLTLTASGSVPAGFKAVVNADVFGGTVAFDGSYGAGETLPKLNGKFSVTSSDGAKLSGALGMPQAQRLSGPFKFVGTLAPDGNKLEIKNMQATAAGQELYGEAAISQDGMVSANIALKNLAIKDILAAVFMPWHEGVGLDDRFAGETPFGWRGEIWLRPEVLDNNLGGQMREAVVGIGFEPSSRSLSIVAQEKNSEPFKLDVSVKQASGSFVLNGSGHGQMMIDAPMRASAGGTVATGALVYDGQFEGRGRSPLATFADLNGKGSYKIGQGKFTALSPDGFYQQLQSVKAADGLQQAFDILLKPPGFGFSVPQQPMTLVKGLAVFAPIAVATEQAGVAITPSFDVANQALKVDVKITAKNNLDLPAVNVAYAGPPGALVARSDTQALSSKLGRDFIAKDVAELERVKQEQEKLAAEEAAQQQEDQAKFAAYQAQRQEMRLRLRELKFFAAQRIVAAETQKLELEKALAQGIAITKQEVPRLLEMLPAP